MENIQVDAAEALQALQRLTANEISRLFTEIAGRDAFIQKLLVRIQELEEKNNGQG